VAIEVDLKVHIGLSGSWQLCLSVSVYEILFVCQEFQIRQRFEILS